MLTIEQRESTALFGTYARLPIGLVTHARGTSIYTEDGSEYMDCIAGLGVNALGHSDPDIIQAINEQASKYLHLSNLYLQEPQIALAEKMSQLGGFERIFFSNSGSEAVEGAIKLARKYHSSDKKAEVIGLAGSFHGRTYGALSIMDRTKYREGFGPFLPGMKTVMSHDALENSISEATAAIILEPIQGEGGIVECPPEALNKLHELREKFGFLIIADEIQSGIGRTGTFFAFEQLGLKPDVVVCAKAIGGGLPLGAILTSSKIAAALSPGTHGTTFGGNALACAAGLVVLDKVENGLMDNAREVGNYLRGRLEMLKTKYSDKIKEVRGRGLMLGLDLKVASSTMLASNIHKDLLKHHFITNVTAETVLRLLPPLIFTEEEAERLVEAIEVAINTEF
jgi:acetylornithine/N-succinyldiaminopimelate aminotransferase